MFFLDNNTESSVKLNKLINIIKIINKLKKILSIYNNTVILLKNNYWKHGILKRIEAIYLNYS